MAALLVTHPETQQRHGPAFYAGIHIVAIAVIAQLAAACVAVITSASMSECSPITNSVLRMALGSAHELVIAQSASALPFVCVGYVCTYVCLNAGDDVWCVETTPRQRAPGCHCAAGLAAHHWKHNS